MKEILLLCCLFFIMLFALNFYLNEKIKCDEKGGSLVRGVILFECVASAK